MDKVLNILKDGCRTAFVALIGNGSELQYILATENMKPGDLIRTHRGIGPVIKVKEGDALPIGRIPVGTEVNCIEKVPGFGGSLIHAAGTAGTVINTTLDGWVVVKMPSKKEFIINPRCMATVGRLSNVDHGITPIGSPQKLRELGYRPRSGLFQKKTGRFGRKIKQPEGPKIIDPKPVIPRKTISLDPYGFR